MDAVGQSCASCGVRFPQGVLACPSCNKLVHSEELKRLALEAEDAAVRGDASAELAAWRSALALLPPHSRQHTQLQDKVRALSLVADGGGPETPKQLPAASGAGENKLRKSLGWLAGAALLVWKFKAILLIVLSKGKLLLMGLTKLPTLFSMLLTMGVYFTLWGWKFAVGFVLSIYVHEMGHVAALRRLGIAASAPMFIPGIGAYVRMHQYPASPSEDARVGLAGPIWGLGAGLACYGMYLATKEPIWAGLAHAAAYLNLFNLIPIWQLDGSRGFHALDKRQRFMLCGIVLFAWALTHETMLFLILLVGGFRAFGKDAPPKPDLRAFTEFTLLIAALSWLVSIHVPGARF